MAALAPPLVAAQNRAPRTNVIFMMADDLGYGDLSCLNPKSKIQTPVMDRMAREGMIFTDAHSPSAVCSPTRYGVMTGRYSFRGELKRGVLNGGSPPLIEPGRLTVASLMKQQGYETACVGKWHLGLEWASADGQLVDAMTANNADFTRPFRRGPTTLGFDYYFGISASLDMPPYTFLENDRVAALPTGQSKGEAFPRNWRPGPTAPGFRHQQVLGTITQKATAWIDGWAAKKSGRPFFLYFPLTAPHTPVLPRDEFKGRTGVGDYGAFVSEVDWSLGQVLEAVRRAGAGANTLIVFTSDNGPERQMEERKIEYQHFSASFYRGHKRHIWDGGHRVPFLARWPERIRPGTSTDETICLTDLMATCAAITGAKLPNEAGEDSFSILPALAGEKYTPPLREPVLHHSASGAFAIRQGEWKLLLLRGTGDGPESKDTRLPAGQLYNMAQDPGEEHNLYDERPEVVKRLRARLDKFLSEGRSAPRR
jgi:arylsulfatase A-like enzyme